MIKPPPRASGRQEQRSLAKRMGATEVVNLLQQSLAEEQAAEKKLRQIASGLMKSAATEAPQAG
jgi:ferritin-like metal-binding protein YciE